MKKYITVEGQTFSVSVSYNKGGFNYFTAKMDERGYYLNVRPVTLEVHDGYTTESYMVFSGYRHLLKTVKRQSPKALSEAVQLSEDMIPVLIDKALSQLQK